MFLEQPSGPVQGPLGDGVVLTCRVSTEHRTAWVITSPGQMLPVIADNSAAVEFLNTMGIVTEVSSRGNREPPLNMNGTMENNGTTLQCIGIDLNNFGWQ